MKEGILSTIGGTPLIRLSRLGAGAEGAVFAKLEGFNPSGSAKDRTARSLIEAALSDGRLVPGKTVVESSSGNLGIGLAQVCRFYGLRFICVVDPKTARKNLEILHAYGATIDMVETPDAATGEYLPARLRRVKVLLNEMPDAYWPDQYSNPNNPRAHHQTMREIVDDLGYEPDYLFCATSTCGTLRGCAEYLRAKGLRTQVIAVDALGSVIFGPTQGRRLIPGHGASVVPRLFSMALASRVLHVSDFDCIRGCRRLLSVEAIMIGGSSGAVVSAWEHARQDLTHPYCAVLIFPDRGERYLDTIYSDDWVRDYFGEDALANCQ